MISKTIDMINTLCHFRNKMAKGVFISLPQEVLEEIDAQCGGPSCPKGKKRSGKAGGRAAWVRRLIYRELGLTEPIDVHEQRKLDFQQLVEQRTRQAESNDWETTVRRLRELRQEGLSLRQVAEVLTREQRPTKRGGKWTAQTVRNLCLRGNEK